MNDIANHLLIALTALKEYMEPYTNDTVAPTTPICGDEAAAWEHGAKLQDLILTVRYFFAKQASDPPDGKRSPLPGYFKHRGTTDTFLTF